MLSAGERSIERECCLDLMGIAFLCIILVLLARPATADTPLTFCYDPYPPYTLGREGSPEGGLKVSLLEAVVSRIDGLQADVILLPWKRCQAQAKSGEVDGILPLFRSEERESYLAFSRNAFSETLVFWYKQEKFPDGLSWDGDFGQLAALRLGMLQGGVIDEAMEATFSANQEILRARDVETAMRLLDLNRVDLVATNLAVGRYVVAQTGLENVLVPLLPPISERASYFGFSKASGADRYVDQFNNALDDLRTSGELARIEQGFVD